MQDLLNFMFLIQLCIENGNTQLHTITIIIWKIRTPKKTVIFLEFEEHGFTTE